MTFMQLVYRNVYRNRRDYLAYFFSSLFSVLVFFIFALLYFHPQLQGQLQASSNTVGALASIGMAVAQVVIVLLSFIFLWYTFSVFMQSRKRDLSVYIMLGASVKDIRKMVIGENLLVGFSSIFSGILIGLLFSKFFLLISQNILAIEDGLQFYLPWKSVCLTMVAFVIIFLVISLFCTIRIKVDELSDMTKTGDRPRPVPKVTWYLSLMCVVMFAIGYGLVFYFAVAVSSFFILLAGVLFTIGGIYLFFHQMVIRVLNHLKKQNYYLEKLHILTINDLIFRMKDNATMYFLISVVAAAAFVGIGTTMVLGGSSFAETQESNVAFTYMPYYYQRDKKYHQKNLAKIQELLESTGEEVTFEELTPAGFYTSGGDHTDPLESIVYNSYSVIPEEQYNRLAASMGIPEIHLASKNAAVCFPRRNSEIKFVNSLPEKTRQLEATFDFGDTQKVLQVLIADYSFNITYTQMMVVSDEVYQEALEISRKQQEAYAQERIDHPEDFEDESASGYMLEPGDNENHVFVFNYPNWSKYGKINNQINKYLGVLADENRKNSEEQSGDTYTTIFNDYYYRSFEYSSLYNTWLETRQANGVIIMVSILLGAVFFTFAACILYFRLFGDLERDSLYHRSLNLLGVSKKMRHWIVTKEMFIMFFLPALLAAVNFAVAFAALKVLLGVSIWEYYFIILAVYFLFQICFYLVSRYRYLKHLDQQVDIVL